MNQDITIRPAAADDRGRWRILRRRLWPDCPARRHALEIAQLLAAEGVVLVAEHRRAGIVGFAEISIRRDHVEGASISPVPYVEGWFVDEGFRGRGVGRALVDAAARWAESRGFRELASDAEPGNETGIRIHGALGFREVGRSVHFLRRLRPPKGATTQPARFGRGKDRRSTGRSARQARRGGSP